MNKVVETQNEYGGTDTFVLGSPKLKHQRYVNEVLNAVRGNAMAGEAGRRLRDRMDELSTEKGLEGDELRDALTPEETAELASLAPDTFGNLSECILPSLVATLRTVTSTKKDGDPVVTDLTSMEVGQVQHWIEENVDFAAGMKVMNDAIMVISESVKVMSEKKA